MEQLSLFASDNKGEGGAPPSLLESLNPSQRQAVTTVDGPVLVIAGAGSGKTRTLVHRLAYLVEQGVDPSSILLLTFTRKAAQEMLSRAAMLMDQSAARVMGGTFHSVANLLLRRYGHFLGYGANFTILDRGDAEGIINLIKGSLDLTGAGRRFPSKRVIINMISGAVNKSMDFDEYLHDRFAHLLEFSGKLHDIRDHYHAFKHEHGLMDYDDLLVNLRDVLRDQPEARAEVAARFRYVMVDEYQDTNRIQAEIVKLICEEHKNIMVVGDDAQSIYSFRGADFRNIMEFPDLFAGCQVVRLEENYRSVQPILEATNAIIAQAEEKFAKTLFSQIEGRDKPILHRAIDEREQARYVVEKINSFRAEGVALKDMAVLFRSGFHSYKLELELVNQQIPFEKRGGLKLTESAHIKDLLAYLHVLTNNQDRLSWHRIFLQLPKVGPKTAAKIYTAIADHESALAGLAAYKPAKSWRQEYGELVKAFDALVHLSAPTALFDQVMDYYQPIFERLYQDDYPSRQRDLEQLRELLGGYETLQEFLDDTALDPPEENGGGGEGDCLILSTVHSAKGLEWQKVFVLNLVEGKFPSGQAQLPQEREEERRLLYVAATRAMEHLFLVAPRRTVGHDRMPQAAMLSGFLEALPQGVLASSAPQVPTFAPPTPRRRVQGVEEVAKSSGGALAINALKAGDTLVHNFFGQGKVQRLLPPKTVEILFPRHGLKKLHLDYAKLSRP
ncbi:MAG: ATP-dependent helicase [Thermodesulfobacteriota bacterium]